MHSTEIPFTYYTIARKRVLANRDRQDDKPNQENNLSNIEKASPPGQGSDIERLIQVQCEYLADFLISKNRAYGNSVFEPVNTFAKGLTAEQQLYVRIDDKLSRMKNGSEYPGDDTTLDLIGYLILLRVMKHVHLED